ncbi:hypothetical protein IAR55_001308 [Kwoniella newhampshirensis]|uniref:Uncharacterized protein n=1 Tax=Kwoniella newhampshirensis TaxID=1651941 RepID=A0AAW0Z5D7_9TREE
MSSASPEAEAESSGQALERYIVNQLASLSISVPQDDLEMMARFVEEEGLEREEKVEGVRAMLEGVVEGGELPEEGVDEALGNVVDERERLVEVEMERNAAEEEAARSPSPPPKTDILSTLTPEELASARKQALLRQYAYVDADPSDVAQLLGASTGRDSHAPPKGAARGTESEEKKAAEERRRLVAEALRLDSRKKKYRKQQEVDLLAPNLNREKVAFAAQMEREAAKKGAQEKRDRDRAALEKQRGDQAKAKADKQKKAAKQERRA